MVPWEFLKKFKQYSKIFLKIPCIIHALEKIIVLIKITLITLFNSPRPVYRWLGKKRKKIIKFLQKKNCIKMKIKFAYRNFINLVYLF